MTNDDDIKREYPFGPEPAFLKSPDHLLTGSAATKVCMVTLSQHRWRFTMAGIVVCRDCSEVKCSS